MSDDHILSMLPVTYLSMTDQLFGLRTFTELRSTWGRKEITESRQLITFFNSKSHNTDLRYAIPYAPHHLLVI